MTHCSSVFLLQPVLSWVFQNDKIEIGNIQVTAVFADGSEAYFKLEGYDHNSDPVFSFTSGKDTDGNFISENAARYMNGAYYFGTGGILARDRFIGAGERLGVPLQMYPEGSVSLGPLVICDDYDDAIMLQDLGCQ